MKLVNKIRKDTGPSQNCTRSCYDPGILKHNLGNQMRLTVNTAAGSDVFIRGWLVDGFPQAAIGRIVLSLKCLLAFFFYFVHKFPESFVASWW